MGKITSAPGALGFFGIEVYHRHWKELKLLAVDGGGVPVYPTLATVTSGQYQPLTRTLYLYVKVERLQLCDRSSLPISVD